MLLTGRELEILQLAGQGLSIKGIAQILGIASGTVAWHLKNSYQKLHAGSREEALRKARAEKLIKSLSLCHVCACLLSTDSGHAGDESSQRH